MLSSYKSIKKSPNRNGQRTDKQFMKEMILYDTKVCSIPIASKEYYSFTFHLLDDKQELHVRDRYAK